jgi:hypothetical protein
VPCRQANSIGDPLGGQVGILEMVVYQLQKLAQIMVWHHSPIYGWMAFEPICGGG